MTTPKAIAERAVRISEVILAARRNYGGNAALAKQLGVHPSAIDQWLAGTSKNLKLANFYGLCRAADYAPEWVALGHGPKRPYSLSSGLADIAEILSQIEDPVARDVLVRELKNFARFRASA